MSNVLNLSVVPMSINCKLLKIAFKESVLSTKQAEVYASCLVPFTVWRIHNLPKTERSRVLRSYSNFSVDLALNGGVVKSNWRELLQDDVSRGSAVYFRRKIEKATYQLLKSGALDVARADK